MIRILFFIITSVIQGAFYLALTVGAGNALWEVFHKSKTRPELISISKANKALWSSKNSYSR